MNFAHFALLLIIKYIAYELIKKKEVHCMKYLKLKIDIAYKLYKKLTCISHVLVFALSWAIFDFILANFYHQSTLVFSISRATFIFSSMLEKISLNERVLFLLFTYFLYEIYQVNNLEILEIKHVKFSIFSVTKNDFFFATTHFNLSISKSTLQLSNFSHSHRIFCCKNKQLF